jgi:transcriptional regulator with XRE-family HTH domain
VDSFGNRLKLTRAHAGHLSIREAADRCDIGRGAWTNWEKGARPSDIIEVTEVIAAKLGVDRDWLLFGGSLTPIEPRSLRRRRSVDFKPLAQTAPTGRRDSTRPVSMVPMIRRRPVPVANPSPRWPSPGAA